MKYKFLGTLNFLLFFVPCNGQNEDSLKFNKVFFVKEIPELKHFFILNEKEKFLDSMLSYYDNQTDSFSNSDSLVSTSIKTDFHINRGRFKLTRFVNGKELFYENNYKDGLAVFCECELNNNELIINSGIGFFGGAGVRIKVYNNQFISEYIEYTDDVKPYKKTRISKFSRGIKVKSKYQYLVFNTPPILNVGQQLTGFLAITSNSYYTKHFREKLDMNHVKVQLYFTCTIKRNSSGK